jgi:tripartite-type tricarboxylate transporter receptor subunit TctC
MAWGRPWPRQRIRLPLSAHDPKNTPAQIVDKLNSEFNALLADAKMKARLVGLGLAVFAGSPADFGKFIAAETEKWGTVIRVASIKAD